MSANGSLAARGAAKLSLWLCFALWAGLGLSLAPAAHAQPEWTTYHRDPGRSGYDPHEASQVSPSFAWQSEGLGAPIWGQPLVLGSTVYIATVGDELYALQATTGKVIWKESAGTPVPSEGESNVLPCGDITPTVGVVGTPVIDVARNEIYLVADTFDEATKEVHHLLEGFSLLDGAKVSSIPIDPPGADPNALLQRTALNLDGERIIFGFGGNDGDCSEYRGTVVSAPQGESGEALYWQVPIAPPAMWGGAVWGVSGPAVDEAGEIFASTGNPNPPPGEESTHFDLSDAIVELNPSNDFVSRPYSEPQLHLGWFEPPNWLEASNSDEDLGSAGPELLPGGVLFQAGKSGTGYLVDEATMQEGAHALFEATVCAGDRSFGGDAYANGTIYVACASGVEALSYNESEKSFSPLWKGPTDAFGPPIISGGVVWDIATGGNSGGGETLYGLNPTNGETEFHETLPSPVEDHFASPSSAGGRLFLATGSSVSAYALTPGLPPKKAKAKKAARADRVARGAPPAREARPKRAGRAPSPRA